MYVLSDFHTLEIGESFHQDKINSAFAWLMAYLETIDLNEEATAEIEEWYKCPVLK